MMYLNVVNDMKFRVLGCYFEYLYMHMSGGFLSIIEKGIQYPSCFLIKFIYKQVFAYQE